MRARGLKHRQREGSQGRSLSRPMRARGLKPDHLSSCPEAEEVASHAGAWIETKRSDSDYQDTEVASHAGAWIETRVPCQVLRR